MEARRSSRASHIELSVGEEMRPTASEGWGDFVRAIRIVELTAGPHKPAVRSLVHAATCDEEAPAADLALHAIEEREAAAQSLVCDDFAFPHAFVDWDGAFRVVIGRSRQGIDYGTTTVRLIILVLIGRRLSAKHTRVLSMLAEMLKESDLRNDLVEAEDARSILTRRQDL